MAEIILYGEIGSEVTAESVLHEVQAAGDEDLKVRISSPGGDVYQALTIMNALRAHPGQVVTVVEGMAASAASVIAIGGGDHVVCRPNAEVMIHEAWTMSMGNAADLTKIVADLDRVSANLSEIYAAKAGTDPAMWRAAMKNETWFTANEALDAGLVDEVVDARAGKKALAGTFNLTKFHFQGRADAPAPQIPNAREGRKGEAMSFLNDVALKLGVKNQADESVILAALDEVLAEQTGQINVQVDLSYPEEVDVKPTDKATVEPLSDVPEGVSFTLGDVPQGWAGEVDEATGVLTVTAPEGKVGDTADFIVTAAGGSETVDFTVTATIIAAAEESSNTPAPDAPADPSADTVTLDKGVYEALLARADKGDRADAEGAKRAAAALVNDAIKSGKVLAVKRDQLTARAIEDFDGMKAYFSKLASGTVPVTELGRGGSDDNDSPERDELVARHRASGGFLARK